jgi:type I restriction enzyme S subunit
MSDPAHLLVDRLDDWTGAIERKNGAGRGNGAKVSLYGIEKLRALILDLAVRGKLVPQDPTDEPASELLQRAYQERKKLVVQGMLSKLKRFDGNSISLPSICLPRGWASDLFGNVFSLEYGDNLPNGKRSQSGEFPVYGSNGIVGSHSEANVHKPCVVVGRKGSAGAVNRCDQPRCWVTDVAYYCVPPTGFDLSYVAILFLTLGLDELGKGIKPGLNRNEAYVLAVSIPPHAEQKRIVAKVNELIALCDVLEAGTREAMTAHEKLVRELLATLVNSKDADDLADNWFRIETNFDTLFTTEESIEALRRVIQDLAVRGKLVEQDSRFDRANQKKLRPDREAEGFDLNAFQDRAAKFVLPTTWSIEPLSRVTSHIVDCPHTTPKWTDSGVLCIKSEQIYSGHLDLSNPKYVSTETYQERIERLEPRTDDILYKREGGILGIGARVPPETPLCMGQRLMLLRANSSVLPAFLELAINSPWVTDFALQKTTGGAAPRVNMAIVRAYPIPLPPLEEQTLILTMVASLDAICEEARQGLSRASTLRNLLADTLTAV